MREYKDEKIEIVREHMCVKCVCDICGEEAVLPVNAEYMTAFDYFSVGRGQGYFKFVHIIDGEDWTEEFDLCCKCSEWLAKLIESGKIRQIQKLIPNGE